MKPNASFIKFKHFPFLFPFLSFFLGEQTDAKTGNDWKSVFLPLTGITTPITPHRVISASMRRVRNTDHMKSIHNPKLLSILQHIEQQDQRQMPTISVTWFPLLYWKLFPRKKKWNKKEVRKFLLFSGKTNGGKRGWEISVPHSWWSKNQIDCELEPENEAWGIGGLKSESLLQRWRNS